MSKGPPYELPDFVGLFDGSENGARSTMIGYRPSIDEVLMDNARNWAQRSTCSRRRVGAVFARDGRAIVSGYNGAIAGAPHCVHPIDHDKDCEAKLMGAAWGCTCEYQIPCDVSVHAERNAISFAAREGIATKGASAHLTLEPCLVCARDMKNAGIVRVVFHEAYRAHDGTWLLANHGIEIEGPGFTATNGTITADEKVYGTNPGRLS